MVLGTEQRAYVAINHKVGPHAPLDGLGHPRVGGVNQIAELATHRLLPLGQRVDVVIDPLVGLVPRRSRAHDTTFEMRDAVELQRVQELGARAPPVRW